MTKLEKDMFKALACAITGLTEELACTREERKRELATKQDLQNTESRILTAIAGSEAEARELNKLLQRTRKTRQRAELLAKKLGRLDDQTP